MTCGGCWLGCADGKLQCARGVELSNLEFSEPNDATNDGAQMGDQVSNGNRAFTDSRSQTNSQRNPASSPQPCSHKLRLPAEAQLVRMLQDAALNIEGAPGLQRAPGMRFVGLLADHGGWMSLGAARAHTGFARDEIEAVAKELQDSGLVSFEGFLTPRTTIRLTERGVASDVEWRARYDAACAEFASSLAESECQQLVDLLFKLRKS